MLDETVVIPANALANNGVARPSARTPLPPPVIIDNKICTGCQLCVNACPQSVLKMIADMSRIEGLVAIVYNPSLCTACRQCEDVCPDFCITVIGGR